MRIIASLMTDARPLLARLLHAPDLARVVPQLPPDVLLRVIDRCGLDDCAELVALATPRQIARVLDTDLWRSARPGASEVLDADRFGQWLEVLVDAGTEVAARAVVGLDPQLVGAALARHVAVFDMAAVSEFTTLDGERMQHRARGGERSAEIGGYVIEATRASSWDAVVALLGHLASKESAHFQRLMRLCMRLSNAGYELDPSYCVLGERDQQMFDVIADRETRRREQGYVTPAEAQAFLQGGRHVSLDDGRPLPDPLWRVHRREFELAAPDDGQEILTDTDREVAASEPEAARADVRLGSGSSGTIDVLRDAGVLASQPRGLLETATAGAPGLTHVERHAAAHPESAGELAFLANVLLAGGTVQGRALTVREAADAAAATCNLGLERWPTAWSDADLVTSFRLGWTVLHREVGMRAAEALLAALEQIECSDRDLRLRLRSLHDRLARHVREQAPWRVQDSLEELLSLDAASWAALVGMVGSCPVLHGAVRPDGPRVLRIDAVRFEFISRSEQIDLVRRFLEDLPSRLVG